MKNSCTKVKMNAPETHSWCAAFEVGKGGVEGLGFLGFLGSFRVFRNFRVLRVFWF